jgi:hypothetical protein
MWDPIGLLTKTYELLKLYYINPLNAELNPIRHLLALVGARHIVDVSRIRVNLRCYVEVTEIGSACVWGEGVGTEGPLTVGLLSLAAFITTLARRPWSHIGK